MRESVGNRRRSGSVLLQLSAQSPPPNQPIEDCRLEYIADSLCLLNRIGFPNGFWILRGKNGNEVNSVRNKINNHYNARSLRTLILTSTEVAASYYILVEVLPKQPLIGEDYINNLMTYKGKSYTNCE